MESKLYEKEWVMAPTLLTEEADAAALAAELGVSEVLARLLYRRGYRTADEALRFFNCTDAVLHPPATLPDIEAAVARICRAVETGEKIVVFGDYDVDGVTATTLLYLYFRELGADVTYYIPSRMGEGYGLSAAAIDKLHAQGAQLIVTVDNGIAAVEEAAYAADLGIDMVITDHHECRLPLPQAVAVVNPHREDSAYPFTDLAGVGVAFKVATAVEIHLSLARGEREVDAVRRMCNRYADLVAIGTVADVMPLVGENRVLVKWGIALLANEPRPGLAALIEESVGRAPDGTPRRKKITASFIGFTLAPRLNAAGRMREAELSAKLLLSEEQETARMLAKELCEINLQRQQEENRIAAEAYARIDEEFDLSKTHVLVLEDNDWRQGVIGIVASRITERYGRPSILISFEGAHDGIPGPQDQGKGSGRSVKGLNLVEALAGSEEYLLRFGGHELAAGLTVRRDKVADFRRSINEWAAPRMAGLTNKPVLQADMELPFSDISMTLASEILSLEPFGAGNPLPHFVVRDVTVERIAELGGGKHLKLTVTKGGRSLYALLFSTCRSEIDFDEGDHVDLLATLEINEYRDACNVQLTVQDVKKSEVHLAQREAAVARYLAIRRGATFKAEEGVLPDRDVCALVYRTLQREYRRGNGELEEWALLSRINEGQERELSYALMKYTLEIFRELKICDVEEYVAGQYRFAVPYRAEKTSIDKSAILKKLRTQCVAE